MHSPDRRSRGVGLAVAAVAIGSVGLVATISISRSAAADRSDRRAVAQAPAARELGPLERAAVARYRQPAAFEALAVQHAQRWAATADHPASLAVGLSPATCDGDQAGAAVFFLPSAVGRPTEEPTTVTVDCRVGAGQRVLADLGGLIATEDANGTEGGYDLADGTRVAFTPEHLPVICGDVLDQGLQPAPRDVALDGEPLADVRAMVSGVFPVAVVEGTPMADDAAALGHPDHVSAAYCGYKALLAPLPPGVHELRATVQGDRTVTWRLHVTA